ncbi:MULTISPECIES: potassium channel beta subunit family protein [Rhodanobacter]|uniref:potassium channel beta subunit family protein n=1 Tax=Rhodanobacter TaxID=75309 RepID=UPI000260CC1E|nr:MULTISPECIES: aldo/keto reductase [Rhodanobacter]EIM04795.1 voltage-gated potassium channel beta subunit [Rhodanobacter denitrificans]KZC21330.1 alcohol dehydrogenase [Rhodanobacter denitrificans]UJM89837.1 aldo/keto reductase [Rhodanobacter denitrificans]UJM94594.1 aldo/keto reductase [Rhodanobacter denitrificans]UJM98124.1 aldo/keto reductase [Rhodanobacter denitrificans]
MLYRRLGTSGLQLSALSFGAWVTFGRQVGRGEARELLALAHDRGVNYFDNAETYNNGVAEQLMGDVLADLRFPRDSYCVSSKVFFGAVDKPLPTQRGLSRKHVMEACHQALQRLRMDYLDLYFCHRPDPDTPIAETVAAMDTLVRQGKVLYWGTSEWPAEAIHEAHRVARENHLYAPAMEQPQYNLLHRERVELEYAPLYEAYGMGTTIWSPLASGLLSGKYNDGVPADSRLAQPGYEWLRESVLGHGDERLGKVRALQPIAAELGTSLAQLAIAWCLLNPHVSTVMLGASKREQLAQNLDALALLPRLDAALAQRIRQVVEAG